MSIWQCYLRMELTRLFRQPLRTTTHIIISHPTAWKKRCRHLICSSFLHILLYSFSGIFVIFPQFPQSSNITLHTHALDWSGGAPSTGWHQKATDGEKEGQNKTVTIPSAHSFPNRQPTHQCFSFPPPLMSP